MLANITAMPTAAAIPRKPASKAQSWLVMLGQTRNCKQHSMPLLIIILRDFCKHIAISCHVGSVAYVEQCIISLSLYHSEPSFRRLFPFATEAAEAAAPPLAGAARAVPNMATVAERTWMTVTALLKIWVRTVRSCIVGYGSVWILEF